MAKPVKRVLGVSLAGFLSATAGCALVYDYSGYRDATGGTSTGGTSTGGMSTGGMSTGGMSTGGTSTGGTGTGGMPATGYHDVTDTSSWATFDVSTVDPATGHFAGAVFDGRYVYFLPNDPNLTEVARYDTQGSFTAKGSWATFDTAAVNIAAKGFAGGAFDGKYLYFVPHYDGDVFQGTVVRYDTGATFADPASWSVFNTATLSTAAAGYAGGVFDGRYLYLVPSANGSPPALAARYDTKATFGVASSWETFDVSTVAPAAAGFFGGVLGGQYLYLVPYNNGLDWDGLVARYDRTLTFSTMGAWSTFDVSTLDPTAIAFWGGVFDGRYVYLSPHGDATPRGRAARFDTQGTFGAASSWSTFNLASLSAAATGFYCAAFDGRRVYFVPFNNGSADGFLVTYDTQGSFDTASSYATLDLTTVDPSAKGYAGAAFDGRYVYLAPRTTTTVARFDARTPPALPPGYKGSFF